MVDVAGKAWQQLARDLGEQLPGSWRVAGSGIKTVVAREPIEWVVVWFGANRVRRDDLPCLIGGDATLLGPRTHLSVGHGLRSDSRQDGPKRIDLTAPEAQELVRDFVVNDLLTKVDPWTVDRLAGEAEAQLALPAGERGRPLRFPDAAGWRVLLGDSSPEDPAEQAASWFDRMDDPETGRWYGDLLSAWRSGGRESARSYLERQRQSALSALKLG